MKIGDYAYIKGCRNIGLGTIIDIYDTPEGKNIDIKMKTRVYKSHINQTISSPNIIDLIEKFDLVNGHLVICKMYEDEKDIPTIIKCVGDYYFKEENIKSIVTHEQFERMQYNLESEVN